MALTQPYDEFIASLASSTTGVSGSPGLNAAGSAAVKAHPHFYNVLDFGAVADYDVGDPTDSTDNTTFFQAAMDAARAAKGTVFVPAGDYYFAQAGAALDPGAGGFSIVGEYGSSVLYFHEGTTGTPRYLFSNITNTDKEHLYFHGLKVVGTFNTRLVDEGGTGYYLDHYPEIKFSYCKWKWCSWMNTDIHFSENVSFDHCTFEDGARDSARTRECKYTSVTNCTFRRMGDDCVAFHGGGYVPGYDPDDGTPRREGLIVSGCFFLDCTSAITALGCRSVIVTGNYSNRSRGAFFYGPNDPAVFNEGITPCHTLLVANNVILNYVGGLVGSQTIINIFGIQAPRDTAQSASTPGTPVTGTGAFTTIWGWDNADMNDAADAYPPAQDWMIVNNIIARRLPAVTNYSDWGFGTLGSHDYDYDPAITDDNMRPQGVAVHSHLRCTISGNHISHVTTGILFATSTAVLPAALASTIFGNAIVDFTVHGINLPDSHIDLAIENNMIYGDIYRKATNSNADGTYDSNAVAPFAIRGGSAASGAVIRNNRFAFVTNIVTDFSTKILENNIAYAQIAAAGFSASNKGVGNIITEEEIGIKYVHVDCDPTSATWGTLLNFQVDSASAKPSSGTYVKGHFVKNTGSAVGRNVLTGWLRMTTGSGHTLDTDWVAIYLGTKQVLIGTATKDPANLPTGSSDSVSVTVTGAAVGDFVQLSFSVNLAGVLLYGHVPAADSVTAIFENLTGSDVDLASGTVRALVTKV